MHTTRYSLVTSKSATIGKRLRNAEHGLGRLPARPSPPHVLIVSMEAKKPRHALAKADFDRLVSRLGAIGNYAIKKEGTTIHIAFEGDADANRLAAVLRPKQTTRESVWASKSLASIDDAAPRRISAFLKRRCEISAPKWIKPRLTRR
jgi:hypothetical protein